MSSNAISSYLTTAGVNRADAASNTKSTDENTLDMTDFITLLVAQLKNQDMNNTTDTTEFMAQMAQYSMVQAINEMNAQNAKASTFNLIGKGATVSVDSQSVMGVIQGVTLSGDEAKVVIGGKEYSMDDLTEVYDASLLENE